MITILQNEGRTFENICAKHLFHHYYGLFHFEVEARLKKKKSNVNLCVERDIINIVYHLIDNAETGIFSIILGEPWGIADGIILVLKN